MRPKFVFLVVIATLVTGLIGLSPAPSVDAGSNGQQLFFYVHHTSKYAGRPGIVWLRVHGTYYDNRVVTWSKSLSSPVNNYSLTNYWWKYWVDVDWRMADGRYGSCRFWVNKNQPSNWVNVGLDRQPGNSCYPSTQ